MQCCAGFGCAADGTEDARLVFRVKGCCSAVCVLIMNCWVDRVVAEAASGEYGPQTREEEEENIFHGQVADRAKGTPPKATPRHHV